MRSRLFISSAVLIASLTFSIASAEVHVLKRDGVGPILVSVRIELSGNGSELHAAARNDSGEPIGHAKFCIQTIIRPKGCDFEIWTTAIWKPGEELTWPILKGPVRPGMWTVTGVTITEFKRPERHITQRNERSSNVPAQPAAMADIMVFKAKLAFDEKRLQETKEWLQRAIGYDKANRPAIELAAEIKAEDAEMEFRDGN